MEKLPIAKFILEENLLNVDSSVFKEGHYFVIEQAMIEFAKLHVTAALKEASEKASVYADEGGYSEFVDEESILNSYPLENIE
jgi:hypothetical protein